MAYRLLLISDQFYLCYAVNMTNVSEKTFSIGGKKRTLIQLNGILAVKSKTVPKQATIWPGGNINTYSAYGWYVVPTEFAKKYQITAPVVLFNKRILLVSGEITIKFADNFSRKEIDEFLKIMNSKIVENLSFANNLFLIQPNDPSADVFDFANAFSLSAVVEFAEPELLEVIS